MKEKWLLWAQTIQSIAQAGLEYSRNPYDRERFEKLREISVEILSEYTGLQTTRLFDLFANENGYQTPKVDVRAVVHRNEKLLLVQEDDGAWALPGGWAEINLSVSENAKKEAAEEAGAVVEPEKVIAILDRNKHLNDHYPYSVYKIFIQCRYLGGSFKENIETTDAAFFSEADLPELSEMRNTKSQIMMCFDYITGKKRELLFD